MIEASGTSLLWVETGNAIDKLVPENVVAYFAGGADACVAFQFEDLCATWPVGIAEQQAAGGEYPVLLPARNPLPHIPCALLAAD